MKSSRLLLSTSAGLLIAIVGCTANVEIISDDNAPNPNVDESGNVYHRCTTRDLTDVELATVEFDLSTRPTSTNGSIEATGPAAVRVYVHRIHASNGSGGLPTNNTTAINAQIDVLNAAYSGTATFTLAAVDDANNDAWYAATDTGSAQTQMKTALRKGTAQDLNVYFNNMGGG